MNFYASLALIVFAFLMGVSAGWGLGADDMQRHILGTIDILRDTAKAAARDAARYRWLRAADVDSVYQGGIFIGQTPANLVLNGEDADSAIDFSMSGHQHAEAGR